MLLLLFFFLVPSLVSGDVDGIREYVRPPTFPEHRYVGTWYRVLHSRQQKYPNDVVKIDKLGYAQFGTLTADFSKPPTFPEVEAGLTVENKKRIQDIWRRMPSAYVPLEQRLTQMTVVHTSRPKVTDPKVSLPSGGSFSPLPGDADILTENADYEGAWYRVIKGNQAVGRDYNVIGLRHGEKPQLGGISWEGTINWKSTTVTNNHLLGGWLLWPHASRTSQASQTSQPSRGPRDLLLIYVKEGKLHYKLTSTQDYILGGGPVEQDTTLPVPVPNEPPVQQSRRPQLPPPLPPRPAAPRPVAPRPATPPPSRLSRLKKVFGWRSR